MNPWPALPYGAWKDTYATLHMWLQIVGKIRLLQSPRVNHQWHVTLSRPLGSRRARDDQGRPRVDYQQALKNRGKMFGGVPETLEASTAP